jgi:hypothetical protein
MKPVKHAIDLLDLGAASRLTKGVANTSYENAACIARGHNICP